MADFVAIYDLHNAVPTQYTQANGILSSLGFQAQVPGGGTRGPVRLPLTTYLVQGITGYTAATVRDILKGRFAAAGLPLARILVTEAADWALWG